MAKNRYSDLLALVTGAEKDFSAFYEKGNKAAGTRVRKALNELRILAQDVRKEVQDIKNSDK